MRLHRPRRDSASTAEPLQLREEPIRQEHVRRPAALGDRRTDAHPHSWRPVRCEHIADVEADDLGEAQASGGGDVRHLLAAQVPSVGEEVKANVASRDQTKR
jgi:hypothetical protein